MESRPSSSITQVLGLEKLGLRELLRTEVVSKWIAIASWSVFAIGFFGGAFSHGTLSQLLGIALISFGFWLFLFQIRHFVGFLESKGKESFLVLAVKAQARKFAGGKDPTPSMLLWFFFKRYAYTAPLFSRLLLNRSSVLSTLEEAAVADRRNGISGATEDILLQTATAEFLEALGKVHEGMRQILISADLEAKDLKDVAVWFDHAFREISESSHFWSMENLRKRGSFGKAWASGFTSTLDRFSIELTDAVKAAGFPKAVGHAQEIAAVERILSRQSLNNTLLVGEPGSGRRTIVLDLASRAVLGESAGGIRHKRIMELDVSSLLAHTKSMREAEALLDAMFQEVVRAGNVILLIDEFHNYVGERGQGALGVADITGIIARYLKLPRFQLIALTTYAGLHRHIEQSPGLLTLFEKVEVTPIQKEQALVILERLVPALERKYRRFVSWQALSSVIEYSDRYIESDPFPRKAIDLLDEALVYLSTSKEQVLLSKHVEKVVEERTQIPIGQMESQERTTLLNLESLIHERIINQEEAVNEVASALRRARSEVTSRKGPMGGFLFLGPTGVGKTETAKALAAIYFGSESRMIRLDMSEFQEIKDIARLLGSATQDGLLTTPVRENPFSLVLLDELEKAHPNILNLFLQVLDEGSVTDGLGRKVSFNNTIIIATSNAGYQIILRTIKEKKAMSEIKEELLDQLFAEGVFRPEFINRFDSVVIFQSLSQEHLLAIAGLMLKKLQRGLEEKGIRFVLTDELKAKMAELGYDPTFGARNMKRVIQDKVENALAEALLAETIKPGDTVSVNPETFLPEKI